MRLPIKVFKKKDITGYMRKNNIKSNLWLIVLQPNTDTSELFKIKSIDHAIVKFDFLRKPKVIQCKRCQGNHTANDAANCDVFKRVIELKASKQKTQTKQNMAKPVNKQSTSSAKQSFADRTKMNHDKPNNPKSFDQFVNNQNKMLNDFMATMKKMQQQFITNYNRNNG